MVTSVEIHSFKVVGKFVAGVSMENREKIMTLLFVLLGASFLFVGCNAGEHDKMHEADLPTSEPVAPIDFDAIFVVNGGDSSISVVNAASNEVVSTVKLKHVSYPHHLYLSMDGTRAVLAVPGMDLSKGHGSDGGDMPHMPGHGITGRSDKFLQANSGMHSMNAAIMVLDTSTGATVVARQLDEANHNGIFAPDGKEIWTSQMTASGSVLVLDASTLATKEQITVGGMPAEITFSRDGLYAFVANSSSDSVSVINVATKDVAMTVNVGESPVGAWQGNDDLMYVDNEAGKSLSAIDAKTHAIVRTYELGFVPGMAATSPLGDSLWVSDVNGGKLVIFKAGSTEKTGEIVTGAGAHAITFSNDGKMAYATNQEAGTLSVIDVAAKAVINTVTVGSKPNGIAFNPKK